MLSDKSMLRPVSGGWLITSLVVSLKSVNSTRSFSWSSVLRGESLRLYLRSVVPRMSTTPLTRRLSMSPCAVPLKLTNALP